MRKAHEAELEKERGKFLDLIAKTYCQADMESLQRQHEYEYNLSSDNQAKFIFPFLAYE